MVVICDMEGDVDAQIHGLDHVELEQDTLSICVSFFSSSVHISHAPILSNTFRICPYSTNMQQKFLTQKS